MEVTLIPKDLQPSIAVIEGRLSVLHQFKYGEDSEIAIGYYFDIEKDSIKIKSQFEVFDIFIRKLLGTPLNEQYIACLYEQLVQNNGIKLDID